MGAFSWDVSFLETDLRVGGGIKSFKQGTECGRELFLVTRLEAGRQEGGRPVIRERDASGLNGFGGGWEQEWRKKGEIRILRSVH